jgi:hypothetical protein
MPWYTAAHHILDNRECLTHVKCEMRTIVNVSGQPVRFMHVILVVINNQVKLGLVCFHKKAIMISESILSQDPLFFNAFCTVVQIFVLLKIC